MLCRTQIRMARCALGMSIRELSRAVGISANALGGIENGRTDPRRTTLAAIERIFESEGVEFARDGARISVTVHDPDWAD